MSNQHPLKDVEKVDLVDALARFCRSYDDMRTVRLNPRAVIPVDQWPGTAQQRGGVIDQRFDEQQYARYVLRTATENERFVEQARRWWAWWETRQTSPHSAGPEPLVLPEIRDALRVAAIRRAAECTSGSRAAATVGAKPRDPEHSAANEGATVAERPKQVDRSYVGTLLTRILDDRLPRHLVAAVTAYLIAKGVLVEADGALGLPGSPGALGGFPADAVSALGTAVAKHYCGNTDAELLGHVLVVRNRGGSGSISQGTGTANYAPAQSLPSREEMARRLNWDRQKHIMTFASMGPELAEEFVDYVIAGLDAHTPATRSAVADNEAPPSREATNEPDGRMLIGWAAILRELGLKNERKNRARVSRMNKNHRGPITWANTRPKVFSGPLVRWINEFDSRRERSSEAVATDVAAELNHPAELKKQGFQIKVRPNNPGSLSRAKDAAK